ncbi:hypothetical protein ACO22_03465 [Paracoccidioides brasiliensis]|uniref:Uncharacterized protein n=1 Tax=Paracoccidioides brasiliensis TaxID=121759 RepID=A0A1D2JFW4_PARBR|nr:hypothetical protein ACO22_03465 [Paracoccidioides brasiliensis]ODH45523.1 hypothetical protein GX48_08400 [Paracoccidioides brasiliensis]
MSELPVNYLARQNTQMTTLLLAWKVMIASRDVHRQLDGKSQGAIPDMVNAEAPWRLKLSLARVAISRDSNHIPCETLAGSRIGSRDLEPPTVDYYQGRMVRSGMRDLMFGLLSATNYPKESDCKCLFRGAVENNEAQH